MMAIGSGQLTGEGLGEGTMNNSKMIPVKMSDSIFAVIGEEAGFIGCVAVILLMTILLARMVYISSKARETFGKCVAAGIFAMFAFNIFENIGMNIGIMPITGLPLPFISKGGSSMVTNYMAIGVLLCYGILLNVVVFIKGKRNSEKLFRKVLYWMRIIISACLAICFVTGAVISCFMIKYAFYNEPPVMDVNGDNGTVVVLGCQIYGENPSVSLRGRLDAAYEYLVTHESCKGIVAGGQGEDEIVPEAYVMKNYLVGRGISENRIIMEDRSENTQQNIRFSGEIIKENNLPETMYIITDIFHSYRAYLFAEKSGYKAYNISSDLYWPLFGEYWVRDLLGILHMKLISN